MDKGNFSNIGVRKNVKCDKCGDVIKVGQVHHKSFCSCSAMYVEKQKNAIEISEHNGKFRHTIYFK